MAGAPSCSQILRISYRYDALESSDGRDGNQERNRLAEVNRILEELKDADWCDRNAGTSGKIHFTLSLEELRKDDD